MMTPPLLPPFSPPDLDGCEKTSAPGERLGPNRAGRLVDHYLGKEREKGRQKGGRGDIPAAVGTIDKLIVMFVDING